jgi:ribonuclease III
VSPLADWAAGSLGHRFRDEALLAQALTHRSASGPHNERLEFLGDAVLGLVAADILYAAHPDADEGALSRLRTRLVRRETLEVLARSLDLGRHLRLGSGELRSGGHHRASILANALEATFGAVYLDAGLTAAQEVIRKLLAPQIAALGADEDLRDPKTRLQEVLQARGESLPVYEVERVTGLAHAQDFSVTCRIDSLGLLVRGQGPSRRAAEQGAAEQALREHLGDER